MPFLPYLIPILVLTAVPFGIELAYGEIFALSIDNQCKTFIKNNLTSSCPSFEALDVLYPSTRCDFDGAGCLNYLRQLGGFHYLIDPEAAVMDRTKTIEIRYNFKEYHLPGSAGYDEINHTINYGVGRYVDKNCHYAYIDSDNFLRLLGDTIYYMHKNCDDSYTYMNEYYSVDLNKTKHDIATSYKYKLEQWIKESKEKCISKCFEY